MRNTGSAARRAFCFLMLASVVASNLGCGLQHSFRRPRAEKKAPWDRPGSSSKRRMNPTQVGYVRAYSTWLADHETMADRLSDSPKIVRDIYARVQDHLRLMKNYMYEREAAVFQNEILKAYEELMSPWPNGSNLPGVQRRLDALEARVRRSFRPGKFPLKRPDDKDATEDEG